MNINDLKIWVKRKWETVDVTIWIIYLCLVLVSIVSLFSASNYLIYAHANGQIFGPVLKHIFFLIVGIVLAGCIQFMKSQYIRLCGYIGLVLSFFLLICTFTGMGVEINGERRWVRLFGFVFQPSDLAKVSLVMVVTDLLSRVKDKQSQKKYFLISLVLTAIISLLIIPTNLSTVVLICLVILAIFVVACIPLSWIGGLISAALGIALGGYFLVENVYIKPNRPLPAVLDRAETWCNRVDKVLDSSDDSTFDFREDWQANVAEVAIANGGKSILGVNAGNSWAKEKLPVAYGDYIFAIIVEQWGIVGAVIVIFLYLGLLFRACYASNKYSTASMLMTMGLAILLAIQAFISMEVAVGIGPVTGQNLPLISHGNTNVLVTSAIIGIMLAVSREQKEIKRQQEETKKESESYVPDF